jgi:rhodanese-related sulfurtransferase
MNRIRRNICQLLGVLALTASASFVGAQETPKTLDGVVIVDAARVRQMMTRTGTSVYDVRVAAEYAEAHIVGAKSLPYREKSTKSVGFDKTQDSFDLAKLPSDKNASIVFYCNAGDCWKSYKASKLAVDGGYKQIHWFRGGLPEWRSNKFPVE